METRSLTIVVSINLIGQIHIVGLDERDPLAREQSGGIVSGKLNQILPNVSAGHERVIIMSVV